VRHRRERFEFSSIQRLFRFHDFEFVSVDRNVFRLVQVGRDFFEFGCLECHDLIHWHVVKQRFVFGLFLRIEQFFEPRSWHHSDWQYHRRYGQNDFFDGFRD